jgi:riboflavin kinase/FMN adenylyltransferase
MSLHVAIGVFDGVHAGHRAVLTSAVAAANQDDGKVIALTFEPHPSRIIRPQNPVLLILNRKQKDARLREAGADEIVHQAFDPVHRAITAEAYIPWLKERFPGLTSLHVGDNFCYGQGRKGDVARLAADGNSQGLSVEIIPPVKTCGEITSSSRIREALVAGELELANSMLVRPYEAEGVIENGRKVGRSIGFPTLNIPWKPELVPAYGVYAGEVVTSEGNAEPAVLNWGVRPTVDTNASEPLLEAHILRLSSTPPVPENTIRVRWLKRMRAEQRFEDLHKLRQQIEVDCLEARKFLGLT